MRTITPEEILDGKSVKYIDVFGVQDNIALKSVFEGKTYWIYDFYCMHPTCNCNNVYLKFIEESKGNIVSEETFGVRLVFNTNECIVEDSSFSKREAKAIADDTLKNSSQAIELFKQRYKQMKQKGTDILTKHGKMSISQVENKTSEVGRNEPCPCGTGKKFKKCCGRV